MTTPLETAQKYYTAEEFMDLDLDPSYRYELVDGVIVKMSHAGGKHGRISTRLLVALYLFLQNLNLGEAIMPIAFRLRIPEALRDTVRIPDLAVLSNEQGAKLDESAADFAPEVAIEVYSPNDRPGELQRKLENYQQAGWDLIWVVYPLTTSPRKKAGTVEIYKLQEETGLQPAQILNQTDILVGEGILEGFTLPVQEIFA